LTEDKKKCFVIMPFSKTKEHHSTEYWKRHFLSYLKPLIEKNTRLEAFRSEPLRGNIASQIITDLASSDIVVADLTDHNPNVLWELGVRQSFKHGTITIAETGTQIPFHFSHKGILLYNGEHLDNQAFEQSFHEALQNCLEHPEATDSPVLEALGGRGSLYGIVHEDENNRRIAALKMEFNENKTVINKIYKKCEENKEIRAAKRGGKIRMESGQLKTSAAEFLHINRYLDIEEDFYVILLDYIDSVLAIKKCMIDWSKQSANVETWILENKENFEEAWANLGNALQKV
jgi:hypothetical protein